MGVFDFNLNYMEAIFLSVSLENILKEEDTNRMEIALLTDDQNVQIIKTL